MTKSTLDISSRPWYISESKRTHILNRRVHDQWEFKLTSFDNSTGNVDAKDSNSFSVLTWNLEAFSRNVYNLKYFATCFMVDLIFICEPQIYQCDVDLNMNHLQGEYCHALNSTDKYDPDLPLVKPKAHGGTMVLWKIQHDPYISVHPVSSAAILPVIFNPPNSPTSLKS